MSHYTQWYATPGAQPRLLLVDDHQLNIRVMYEIFRHEFDVFIALNGEQALEKCAELHPDLILLDVVMPRLDGYEVCRRLKADPELADIPVIFITSHFDEADEVRGFELGAVDFIHKPVNPIITKARVKTQLQLKQQTDLLRAISQIDGLTGIANRRRFDQQLELEWRSCCRSGEPLSLLMLDIDYFKQYNDEFGHLAGDECLRRVAMAMQQAIGRPYDLLARFGGEEFAVLLPRTNSHGAQFLAQNILLKIQHLALSHPYSPGGIVTLSAGLATVVPLEHIQARQLLQRADEMLYKAKQQGRNRLLVDESLI